MKKLEARFILIASGARPDPLGIARQRTGHYQRSIAAAGSHDFEKCRA
jgi:hypothetical protein